MERISRPQGGEDSQAEETSMGISEDIIPKILEGKPGSSIMMTNGRSFRYGGKIKKKKRRKSNLR